MRNDNILAPSRNLCSVQRCDAEPDQLLCWLRAVAHREPMASETATAKAVTSKTPAMASTTAMA